MNPLKLLKGLLKKELALEGNFGFRLLIKLVMGPLISVCTAGILYSGFFSANSSLQLGPLNEQNFKPLLLIGFLLHSILNSGYYFLSNKLLTEKWMNTLPLLWLSPCPPWMALFGMVLTEALRCIILSILCLTLVLYFFPVKWSLILFLVYNLGYLFLLGCVLGLGRTLWGLMHQGKTEFPDQVYLMFLFSSCLYIPKILLPKLLSPIISMNPIYQLSHGLQILWRGESLEAFSLILAPWGLLICLISALLLLWRRLKSTLIENSFI